MREGSRAFLRFSWPGYWLPGLEREGQPSAPETSPAKSREEMLSRPPSATTSYYVWLPSPYPSSLPGDHQPLEK